MSVHGNTSSWLHIYTRLGEPLRILFPILGIHDVGSLFAPAEAVSVERATVDGVEESADMTLSAEIDSRELY
jgi:hypothetical protein